MTTNDRAIISSNRSRTGPKPEPAADPHQAARSIATLQSSRWLIAFLVIEFGCQLALLSPSFSGFRIFIRTAAFATSLLLFLIPGKSVAPNPVRNVAIVCVLILVFSAFHPDTSNAVVAIATVLLNLAILGPLFWVPRIRLDAAALRRVFLLVWAFQTASAALSVLQIYFPGRFDPATSSTLSEGTLQALQITLADGTRVFRPMGLTDTPGGSALGGMYSVLFAMALWLERPRFLFRIVLLLSMTVGLFALYLCQIRSLLVMLIPSFITAAWSQMSRMRLREVVAMVAPLAVTAIVAFIFAVAVGGDAVTGRLSTLIEADPQTVFYSNRGFFLEHTFTKLLPEYPLGAGLGRWGMIASYFNDGGNPASTPIWAEIQWTGWLIDGGIPLMISWAVALFVAFRATFAVAISKDASLRAISTWAGILVGYSMGLIALMFNGCPFAGTLGIDFWLLNAALVTAASQARLLGGDGLPQNQGVTRNVRRLT